MATSQRRSSLVASVAHALSFAINDPSGHNAWALSQSYESPTKRLRGAVETTRSATVFDSSAIPPIGIDKYLMRLSASFKCSDASFIAALILVDRLLEYDGGRLPLTQQNVHRIFLASLVVAVKYHEDLVYSNSHYAKAGGVHLKEVNRLERVILATLDFDLRILPEQYQTYEAALLAFSGNSGHSKELATTERGVPHKPLASEGAVAPTASAVGMPAARASVAPAAPPTNPSLSAAIVKHEDASTEAPMNALTSAERLWQAAPMYDAAVHRKVVAFPSQPARMTMAGGPTLWAKSRPDGDTCVPWVPLDRAILNLELELLAVPVSR